MRYCFCCCHHWGKSWTNYSVDVTVQGGQEVNKVLSITMSNRTQTISQDSTRAATDRLFERGQNLVQQHTRETLQQALLKFTEALKLYR
jgi:hypothetical protein